jgi:hypothetical protein
VDSHDRNIAQTNVVKKDHGKITHQPMKTTTLILVLSMLFISPGSYQAQEKSDDKLAALVCAVLVVGVGTVVIIGLVKLCQKIPTPDAPPPAPPYYPPTIPTSTTNLPKWFKRISPPLSDVAISSYDISGYAIPDGYSSAKSLATFKTLTAMRVECSTNLSQWSEEMTITQWISDHGIFSAVYRDGSNVMNTYSSGITNYVPMEIGEGDKKFWRVVTP